MTARQQSMDTLRVIGLVAITGVLVFLGVVSVVNRLYFELATDGGVELVTGQPVQAAERLEGSTGTVAAEWLVRARQGASVTVRLLSENAGHDQETQTVSKGASR